MLHYRASDIPEVVDCWLMTGNRDYLLRVATSGLNDFEKFLVSNLTKIKGDIRDAKLLNSIIPGNETLIHLACISNDPSFELNPKLGKSINLDAFEPLVKSAKKNNINKMDISPKYQILKNFDLIDKSLENLLLNLSYKINQELFKAQLIKKIISKDSFKYLSLIHI